jgi:membrane-associated phospholipid phosphatase
MVWDSFAMNSGEQSVTRRLTAATTTILRALPLPWRTTLLIALIDVAWITIGGWSLRATQQLSLLVIACCSLAPLLFVERYRDDPKVRGTVLAAFQLISFSAVASILSYLAVGAGAPLFDDDFAKLDRAIGFDWLTAAYWINDRPLLKQAFSVAYHSGLVQVGMVVLFLGFTARTDQLEEFVGLYVGGLVLAIAISLVIPAAGPWYGIRHATPFDASVLSHFEPLHNGGTRIIDLDHAQGLISMPSAHAMMAVFLVYAMRGTGMLFIFFFGLNVLMLAATPTEGGHYLVDVIGGMVCASALIIAFRREKSVIVSTLT